MFNNHSHAEKRAAAVREGLRSGRPLTQWIMGLVFGLLTTAATASTSFGKLVIDVDESEVAHIDTQVGGTGFVIVSEKPRAIKKITLDKPISYPDGVRGHGSLSLKSVIVNRTSGEEFICNLTADLRSLNGVQVITDFGTSSCEIPTFLGSSIDIETKVTGFMNIFNTSGENFNFKTNFTMSMLGGIEIPGSFEFNVPAHSCSLSIDNPLLNLGSVSYEALKKLSPGTLVDNLKGEVTATLHCPHNYTWVYLGLDSTSGVEDGCVLDNLGALNYCAFIDDEKIPAGAGTITINGSHSQPERHKILFRAVKGKKDISGKSQAIAVFTLSPQ